MVILEEGTSIEKMCQFDWLVGKPVGALFWLIVVCWPGYCGWCYAWVCGSELYEKIRLSKPWKESQ